MSETHGEPPPARQPIGNRIFAWLLRSPLSRLVDRSVMLLTVTGRRTGRPYTFPVQYVQDGDVLWVFAGGDESKTWWRNLVCGGDVEVLVRRRRHSGRGVAYAPEEHPEVVAEGLRRFAGRFPRTAKYFGIGPAGTATGRRAPASRVVVRIELGS